MRLGAVWLVGFALLPICRVAPAQVQPPSEKLQVRCKSAFTWSHNSTQIILLEGPLTVTLDNATLSARDAVLWLTPVANGATGEQHAEIELIGDAKLEQPMATRTADHLYVPVEILGNEQISTSDQRVARDMSDSPLYRRAEELREQAATRPSVSAATSRASTTAPASRSSRTAAEPAENGMAIHFEAGQTQIVDTEEGTVAIVMWGPQGVKVRAQQPSGDYVQMQAERAVVFTAFQSLHDMNNSEKLDEGTKKVTAVYLEGDARIEYIPTKGVMGEQRLRAQRVYYELTTDRAILVDAVMHTLLPQQQVPVIMRAKTIRQLSKDEFNNKSVQLTSSAFAVPSYSIGADQLYFHAEATGDPQFPEVVNFQATNATLQAFDVPFFYLPYAAGSMGDKPGPMREIGFTHRTDLGYSFLSDWGLFETLGQVPPKTLDAAYRVDYFGDRGPGVGLDSAWGGGSLTEPEHQPWNFRGDLRSYFIFDKGTDAAFGRLPVKPDGSGYDFRGRAVFEHQYYFPDDWEAQVKLGYVSDATFMEEWFPTQFMEEGPIDEAAYLKRQRGDEAFTMLVEAQPNRLVTTSERMAEQFEVERLPEITYHREGDSAANDSLTIFSDNSASGLEFQHTRATLAQQGFRVPDILPGIPALGQTGLTKDVTWRGDFREELDWPLATGHFKVVPYLVGRYTEYSNSPSDQSQARLFGAAGTRVSTTFWKLDPTAESDIFDIHQLRHIVEPTLNLFTSGTTTDRNHLFMYDTAVDAINDISAVDIGLHQRWQTQRGGPDRWRSVDIFTLDFNADFYANKPRGFGFRNPFDFRGVYFSTLPEMSVPRDALNGDASWRLTDNTIVLADAQYNLDARKLATAAVGVLVSRDVSQSWYLGNRYIADLHSNIATVQMSYQINPKYTISFSQSFDFGLNKDVSSNIAVIRFFDRFVMVFNFSHDQISNQTSFDFAIAPTGFAGISSSMVRGPFQR